MFVMQNKQHPNLALHGISSEKLEIDYPIAKFDLTVTVVEQAIQGLEVAFEFSTDLFYAETIQQLALHFKGYYKVL